MSEGRIVSPRSIAVILAAKADRLDYENQGEFRLPDHHKVEVPLGDLRALGRALADIPGPDLLTPLLELLREQHGEMLLERGEHNDGYRLGAGGTVSLRVGVGLGRRILQMWTGGEPPGPGWSRGSLEDQP